jgi:hypothetical protein
VKRREASVLGEPASRGETQCASEARAYGRRGGCGGLDRETAAKLIRDRYFGEDGGVTLRLELDPSAFIVDMGITHGSATIADCGRRAIGWASRPHAVGRFHALAAAGALRTCSTARVNAFATGPTLGATTPMTCGTDVIAMDAINEYEDRVEAVPLDERRHSPVAFVVEFPNAALTGEHCASYVERSESNVQDAGRFRDPEETWLRVSIPGTSRFGEVTGLSDGPDGTRTVEFMWTPNTEALQPLQDSFSHLREGDTWPTGSTRTSRATFRRFDDGWRIDSVAWGG